MLNSTTILAQKNSKYTISTVDRVQQNSSSKLVYYKWDPNYLNAKKNRLNDQATDQSNNNKGYLLQLRKGAQELYILSSFMDTLVINFNLQKDTVIDVQELIQDYYQLASNDRPAFHGVEPGDKVTICVQQQLNNQKSQQCFDLDINEVEKSDLEFVNRGQANFSNKQLDNDISIQWIGNSEQKAKPSKTTDRPKHIMTIRKNKKVAEYRFS